MHIKLKTSAEKYIPNQSELQVSSAEFSVCNMSTVLSV